MIVRPWPSAVAAKSLRAGVFAGMYRDQSPRKAPNETGFRHHDEGGEHEGGQETSEEVLAGARIRRVERAREGDDRQEEEHRVRDDGRLVDQQHELVAVHDHDDHDQADEAVDDRAEADGVGHAGETVERADEGVAADPDRDRVERDGGQEREERADDAAADAEEGAGGDGVVGAGLRAEETHRHEHEDAGREAEHHRADGLPERQAEQDGEGAEQHGGEGVRAAELDAHQVDPGRRAVGVGHRVDAALLHLRGLGARVQGDVVVRRDNDSVVGHEGPLLGKAGGGLRGCAVRLTIDASFLSCKAS